MATYSTSAGLQLTWTSTNATGNAFIYSRDTFADLGTTPLSGVNVPVGQAIAVGGTYHFTLMLDGVPGSVPAHLAVDTSIFVAGPDVPTITSANPALVNPLVVPPAQPARPTLRWGAVANAFEQVRPKTYPESLWVGSSANSLTSYTVPASDLTPGRHVYEIRSCRTADGVCSEPALATVIVGPATFDTYRKTVLPGSSVTLTWTGPGTSWFLLSSDPTIAPGGWIGVNQRTVTFTAPTTPNLYPIQLVSCVGALCSNRTDVLADHSGTITSVLNTGASVTAGQTIIATITDASGGVWPQRSPKSGQIGYGGLTGQAGPVAVTAGQLIAPVITNDVDTMQLAVSNTVWTTTSISDDFQSETGEVPNAAATDRTATQLPGSRRLPVWSEPTAGAPLDVLIDHRGQVWSVNEFSQSLSGPSNPNDALLDGNGVPLADRLADYEVPLKHSPAQPVFETAPFGFDGIDTVVTPKSTLGERIIEADNKIWFTQGGAQFMQTWNHSRIVSFDPNGTDDRTTPQDDRFCGYSVPENANSVVGLAWQPGNPPATNHGKLFFTEARPGGTGRISWIDLDDANLHCDTMLDYSQPGGGATSVPGAHAYCTAQITTGCINSMLLPGPAVPPAINPAQVNYAAQLAYDPGSQSTPALPAIWFTDAYGKFGRLDLTTWSIDVWNAPTPSRLTWESFSGVLSFPWQIRVDNDYVYFIEWVDGDIVRSTKPAHGGQPTMSEIHLPLNSGDLRGHSVELVNGKLWFTLKNPSIDLASPAASTIGYVDVAAWKAGSPTGKIYQNWLQFVDPARESLGPAAFAGISVSATGVVAVADFQRKLIHYLKPKP